MSETVCFTDDEDILAGFGRLTRLYPGEGAEALWLHAGGQIRRTTTVSEEEVYPDTPDTTECDIEIDCIWCPICNEEIELP